MNGNITWLSVNVRKFEISNDNVIFIVMEIHIVVLLKKDCFEIYT